MFCFDTCVLRVQVAGEPFWTFDSVVSFYVKAVKSFESFDELKSWRPRVDKR